MDKEEFVRGKKRQRRKAPKARSGCITCKIRRVKCDETKPSCNKCTSTGRKCDGYIQIPAPNAPETITKARPTLAFCQALSACILSPALSPQASATAEIADKAHEHTQSYEPPNETIPFPLLPTAFPTSHLPGRAFHYFIHRSSVDLTGPLHSQVWQKYVLSVCATSPVIQHAVVALSCFHERYSFPKSGISDELCWRQYYIAVKSTNELVTAASESESEMPKTTDEILIACAIFITIEILLGNTEAAMRHLQGGLSLVQAYLTKDCLPLPQTLQGRGTDYGLPGVKPTNSPAQLNPHTMDLVGFFARLDLQVLSCLPKRHRSISKTASPPKYAIPHLSHQPLPNWTSATLYRLMKDILYWIRHWAIPFKYSPNIPQKLLQAQNSFLDALQSWKASYLDGKEEDFSWIHDCTEPSATTAHLLLTYHLMFLKLHTALSPSETIFSTKECFQSFAAILCYTFIVVRQRNAKLDPVYLPQGVMQSEFFFSLESSIVEVLYYTALKCRHPILRRCALGLLKCAGREGVWDGAIMAKVAEHVIRCEEDPTPLVTNGMQDESHKCKDKDVMSHSDFCQVWALAGELNEKLILGEDIRGKKADGSSEEELVEENLVHTVHVDVNRQQRRVEVECGWFIERERTWKHEATVLTWECCGGWPWKSGQWAFC